MITILISGEQIAVSQRVAEEIERLRAALEPFAYCFNNLVDVDQWHDPVGFVSSRMIRNATLTFGDLRRASAILSK